MMLADKASPVIKTNVIRGWLVGYCWDTVSVLEGYNILPPTRQRVLQRGVH